jgi:hypothetical protein
MLEGMLNQEFDNISNIMAGLIADPEARDQFVTTGEFPQRQGPSGGMEWDISILQSETAPEFGGYDPEAIFSWFLTLNELLKPYYIEE